jgi:serine/arginine repetitive matrix protein 1
VLTSPQPKIKEIQIQLTGFLGKDVGSFCLQLWKMLLSAQASSNGVPTELLEAKKREIVEAKVRWPITLCISNITDMACS